MSIVLAALGGVLHFLGFVGFGYWPLAFVALVPLWLALAAPGTTLRRALALGAVFGWVSYAGGFLWLAEALAVFVAGARWLIAALWLADSLWFALRFALYAALTHLVTQRGWPMALAGVPALVVVEWCYPMLFPVHVGHALAARPLLIQASDVGGPLLLTAFVALGNAALYELWRWYRGAPPARATWAAAAAALVAVLAYGVVRIAAIERAMARGPFLEIGIVQGNLGVQEKGVRAARDHARYLAQSRELLAGGAVDLLVWPETVYTRGVRGPLPVAGDLIRRDLATPLLLGAAYVDGSDGQRRAYNAALLIDGDGMVRSAYRKNLLIPFTEFVPFPDWLPASPAASHFAAAADTPPLALGAWRLATPICYEAVRPAFVRRMMRAAHPQVLVTLANDAWFGDSQGPWLHLRMAALRAVEHRRYLVRATNSGVSAIIDPTGREVARTGLLTRENLRGRIAWMDETTWYTRAGDWPGWLAAAILLVGMMRRRDGAPRRGPAPSR